MDSDRPLNVDDIVERLRARVDERRKAGVYPIELETELAEHFRRIAQYRIEPNIDAVRAALVEFERHLDFTTEKISAESGVPGGERVHRTLAKLQSRQIDGVLHQVWEFADATRAALLALADAVASPHSHVHPDLLDQVDALLDRLAAYERLPQADPVGAELRRRLEEVERGGAARKRLHPLLDRARLAEEFGPPRRPDDLAARLSDYQPVVELAKVDPVRELASAEDGSIGALLIEVPGALLDATGLAEVATLAYDKVQPGGAVLCIGNGIDLPAPLASYEVDARYLDYILRASGFAKVELEPAAVDDGLYVVTALR